MPSGETVVITQETVPASDHAPVTEPATEPVTAVRTREQIEIHSGFAAVDRAINPVIAAAAAPNEETGVSAFDTFKSAAWIVWLSGAGLMLIYAALSFIRLRWMVRASVKESDGVYICDEVKTPFILGVIKPRIYLPSGMDEDSRECVLAHERAHLARLDHLSKPFGFLLLSVYWFNPLIWLAYVLFCRDIEIACDEKVIKKLPDENRATYSQALLSCGVSRRMIAACPLAFGEVGIKERVKKVLSYKKPALWIIIAALIICGVLAGCLLTNPKDSGVTVKESVLIPAGNVTGVNIGFSTMWENGSYYTDNANDIRALADFFAAVDPVAQFDEKPDEFDFGEKLYTVSFMYDDKSKQNLQLYDSAWITAGGKYYKLESEKTQELDVIFESLHKISTDSLEYCRMAFPEYFGLDTSDGLDVYVCRPPYITLCYLFPSSQRPVDSGKLLISKGITAAQMKVILSTYDIPAEKVNVIAVAADAVSKDSATVSPITDKLSVSDDTLDKVMQTAREEFGPNYNYMESPYLSLYSGSVGTLIKSTDIASVIVYSAQESVSYYIGEAADIRSMADWFCGLQLTSDYNESLDGFVDADYNITFRYADGSFGILELYGDLFICADFTKMYKADGAQAQSFKTLLDSVKKIETSSLEFCKAFYPEFFGLDTSEGLDVYVCRFAPNLIYCTLRSASDKPSDSIELMNSRDTHVQQMKLILSTYDIPPKKINIIPYTNMLSSYVGDHGGFIALLKEQFGTEYNYDTDPLPGYSYIEPSGEDGHFE